MGVPSIGNDGVPHLARCEQTENITFPHPLDVCGKYGFEINNNLLFQYCLVGTTKLLFY